MKRLAMDRRGVAAMIVAIVMPVLLLVVAMAVDLSRVYIVKQRLQTSVDAAVSTISQEGTTADPLTTGIETDATNLFWNNFGSPQGQKKTGPLGATVPSSLTIGPYDSTIQKVPVSATASVPLVFGGLLHRGSMSVSALGYAAFGTQTNAGSTSWINLFCYGNNTITSGSCLYWDSTLTVNQPTTGTGPAVIDGPICVGMQNGTAIANCTQVKITAGTLNINYNATFSGQSTDTYGSACSDCMQVELTGGGEIYSGTTTFTNITVLLDNPFTLASGTTLNLGQGAQFCDNGVTANGSANGVTATGTTINVSDGAILGCQNYQSPYLYMNNSTLNVSGNSTVLFRELDLNGTQSPMTMSDSKLTVTDMFEVGQNTVAITGSTFSVGTYLDIGETGTGGNVTIDSSTGTVSGLKLQNGSTLTLSNNSSVIVGQSGNSSNLTSNSIINVESGSYLKFSAFTNINGLALNVNGGSKVVFSAANGYNYSNFTVNVSGAGSSVSFSPSILSSQVTVHNSGGTVTGVN